MHTLKSCLGFSSEHCLQNSTFSRQHPSPDEFQGTGKGVSLFLPLQTGAKGIFQVTIDGDTFPGASRKLL